jgi:hypothetical protein
MAFNVMILIERYAQISTPTFHEFSGKLSGTTFDN